MGTGLYSIPAISWGPECVFSGTEHIIAGNWSRLSSETTEILKYLNSCVRLNSFTEEYLRGIVTAMEDKEFFFDRKD